MFGVRPLNTASEMSTASSSSDSRRAFFLQSRTHFIYLSGCLVCLLVKARTGLQTPSSPQLLLHLRDPIPWATRQSCPLLLILCADFSFSRETDPDLRGKPALGWLNCDSSTLILLFITLYGIPLVVTKRHISLERLEAKERVFESRG